MKIKNKEEIEKIFNKELFIMINNHIINYTTETEKNLFDIIEFIVEIGE